MANKKVLKLAKKKNQITLKNSDLEMLINCDGLTRLRESKDMHGNPVDLSAAFSFKLSIILDKLQSPINAFVKQKQNLVDKYGDKDAQGKLIQPNPGQFLFTTKAQWFQKEFTELLNVEFIIQEGKLEMQINDVPKGVVSTNDIFALKSIINFKDSQ